MKKRILKILALCAGIILILGVCIFANSLVGNPISKALATSTAKKHLKENYANTYYELGDVSYSFKDGYYHAQVFSPRSIDSSFSLLINGLGKLRYDYYENNVTNGWNTAYRLRDDYRKTVDTLIESDSFPYAVILGYGDLEFITAEYKDMPDIPEYALLTNDLTLDSYYNVNELGKKAGVLTLYIADETVSEERLAEILLGIRECFDRAGVGFYIIDCVLEYPQNENAEYRYGNVEISEFLYSDIYADGLVERVKAAAEKTENYYAEQDAEKLKEKP
jgi:hypothetical protein